MIARLTGTIAELKPTEVILDIQGVGYQVMIPFSTYEKICSGERASLHIYTLHKEDQFKLYGFFSEEEKKIFSLLLDISGIGPSMALSILSGMSIPDLIDAVKNGNTHLLVKIPGIGKSKAEKLVFELSRKTKKLDELNITSRAERSVRRDVIEALHSLGFEENKISPVIDEILKEDPEVSLEKAVKEALRRLSL
ncbi:MAG TPA: Holliday junction branch migration protein RuvA [Spirochaetota bacterium]|nr:Holliday junction branch migration protein RuvA [Spirochaetota bacterium]HPI89824.1 Holliday junction branch migration protein RuvA [Spirochaetota bacterium]HPR49394.1 Holliday junction branch migration protein RuvA [Spirochaetota bacterium]